MAAPRLHGCIQLDPAGWKVGEGWTCNQYSCQINETDVGRVAVLYPTPEEELAPQRVQVLFVDLPGNPLSVKPWNQPRRLCSPQRERIFQQGGEALAECLAKSIGEAPDAIVMRNPFATADQKSDAWSAMIAAQPGPDHERAMAALERERELKQAEAVTAARAIVAQPCDANTELMLDDTEAWQAYARHRLRDLEVLMGGTVVDLGWSDGLGSCEATSGDTVTLGPWDAVTFYDPHGAVEWTALQVGGLVLLHSYEMDLELTLNDPAPLDALQSARYYCRAPACRE